MSRMGYVMALQMLLVLVMTSRLHVLVCVTWHSAKSLTHHHPLVARDSYKDEIIVRSFLIITIGLVLFALIRPYFNQWLKVC